MAREYAHTVDTSYATSRDKSKKIAGYWHMKLRLLANTVMGITLSKLISYI